MRKYATKSMWKHSWDGFHYKRMGIRTIFSTEGPTAATHKIWTSRTTIYFMFLNYKLRNRWKFQSMRKKKYGLHSIHKLNLGPSVWEPGVLIPGPLSPSLKETSHIPINACPELILCKYKYIITFCRLYFCVKITVKVY
jgi:hypothetical protein